MARRPMRYCLLDCEDAAKWAGHEQLSHALLHPGASWEHYRCFAGQLPPLEGLAERCDGCVITGSHYSVYEDRPWIRALEAWLREAATRSVRILGQCFGAQVVAQALGGRVGPNPDGGFVLGVETVQLAEPLRRSAALRLAAADVAATAAAAHGNSSGVGNSARVDSAATAGGMGSIAHVRIIQSHGDQVLQLPPGAVLLAASPTAPIEMFAAAGGNILAVQGHAELSAEETIQKILSAVAAAGRLSAEAAAESKRSLEEEPTDAALVAALYRHFMELGLADAASGQLN